MSEKNIKVQISPVSISEETTQKLLDPAAEVIGSTFGELLEAVFHLSFDGVRKFNIQRRVDIDDFQNRVTKKNEQIPIECRDSDKMGLALKALESSRYQINEEIMKELFSTLISSTLDSRKNHSVLPIFSTILSEMSVDDAQLLNYFFNRKHLFENQISHSNPAFEDERYRLFSPKTYYGISSEYSDDLYRNPQDATDCLFEDVYSYEVPYSVLFLESKGLIFKDTSQYSHALIYAIEANSLKNNDWLKEVINRFSNYEYNRVTEQITTVYSLTSLGQSLADLVCHKD